MKTIINVECMDQELVITNSPIIATGGVHENYIAFNFCEKWDGFVKTAVFYRNEKERYYSLLGLDDVCEVPHEVTDYEGTMYFGVFGVFGESGEVTRTSKIVKYKITKGAMTTSLKPSEEPTPDIYQQLLSAYGQTNEAIAMENAERQAEIAVERERINQLSTYVTPEMFGAKGDGETDDTMAIKEAFKHKCVLLNGSYKVTDSIPLHNKLNVHGIRDARIIGVGLTKPLFTINKESTWYIVFENYIIESNTTAIKFDTSDTNYYLATCLFRDLIIKSDDVAIDCASSCMQLIMDHINIQNSGVGLNIGGSDCVFDGLNVWGCETGIIHTGSANKICNSKFYLNDNAGSILGDANQLSNVEFQENKKGVILGGQYGQYNVVCNSNSPDSNTEGTNVVVTTRMSICNIVSINTLSHIKPSRFIELNNALCDINLVIQSQYRKPESKSIIDESSNVNIKANGKDIYTELIPTFDFVNIPDGITCEQNGSSIHIFGTLKNDTNVNLLGEWGNLKNNLPQNLRVSSNIGVNIQDNSGNIYQTVFEVIKNHISWISVPLKTGSVDVWVNLKIEQLTNDNFVLS